MNAHGFWSSANARANSPTKHTRYEHVLRAPPGRPDPYLAPAAGWRTHPDTAAVERALVAKCQKEQHRDS